MRIYEIISAFFFSILGFAVIVGGLRLGFGQWQDPGQGFMAVLAGVSLTFLSALWIALIMMKRGGLGTVKSFFATEQSHKKVLFTLLPLVLYAVLLEALGFPLTIFLFLVFLFRVIKPQSWSSSLITALIVSVTSFILFEILLKVQFPPGIFNLNRIKYWIF